MPSVRASRQSYASLQHLMSGKHAKIRERRTLTSKINKDQPIIIVHNHIPRTRCNAHRAKPKSAALPKKKEAVPDSPGWRGLMQKGYRLGRQTVMFIIQGLVLISSLMPRINVGIGINPVWPESWPRFMRR